MPPKTRATKATKTLKENFNVSTKSKPKIQEKSSKHPRKALADKTNSTSEDIVSLPKSRKLLKKDVNKIGKNEELNTERSRRVRRLPNRYEENNLLKNLSNNNALTPEKVVSLPSTKDAPLQEAPIAISLHKVPLKIVNSPLVNKRPKRMHKLPNKFNDHTLSPKFIPIKPVYASTPKANKLLKENRDQIKRGKQVTKVTPRALEVNNEKVSKNKAKDTPTKRKKSDTNNNGLQQLRNGLLNTSKTVSITAAHDIKSSPKNQNHRVFKNTPFTNNSLRLSEEKACVKRDASKLDVYEFTFDPNEEPPPPKKKKKRVNKKNPSKPKTVTFKNTYDKNLAKALAALKKTVSAKSSQPSSVELQKERVTLQGNCVNINVNETKSTQSVDAPISVSGENTHNSVRVEDIGLQVQEDDHPINYSPVNSPVRTSPVHNMDVNQETSDKPHNKDPLNLLDDISFFDEQPVASSSINTSVRHPLASPWRVEFSNLPIKWPVNTYVKPNMTPAVETSFIDGCDNKKKHVYTNIIPETNDSLPQIVENTPNLKQTSIMSFIREVIDKSASKKRTNKIVNNNSLFEEISYNKTASHTTPQKNHFSDNILSPIKNVENVEKNISADKHNNKKQNRDISSEDYGPKDVEKDVTYFGFDESEDQENISPVKKNNKAKALRSKSRAVLHEINGFRNTEKVVVPRAAKSKPALNDADKVFNEMKSAMEPPVFPAVNFHCNSESTNINNPTLQKELENDDSQSVHLFEDLELIHHLKPTRKSYVKTKKVTFRQNSGDSDSLDSDVDFERNSGDEDLDDLSFKIPSIKEKRATKKKKTKKQLSKKEEKEVEAWAAGFNSMCEDIEDYDLVVE